MSSDQEGQARLFLCGAQHFLAEALPDPVGVVAQGLTEAQQIRDQLRVVFETGISRVAYLERLYLISYARLPMIGSVFISASNRVIRSPFAAIGLPAY
jgi:hypothetical protein